MPKQTHRVTRAAAMPAARIELHPEPVEAKAKPTRSKPKADDKSDD